MSVVSFPHFAKRFLAPSNGLKRILAIDYGSRKCGLAVCDYPRFGIRELKAVKRNPHTVRGKHQRQGDVHVVERVLHTIHQHQVGALVVGIPFLPSGGLAPQAAESIRFVRLLREIGDVHLPLVLADETGSTVAARDLLRGRVGPGRRVTQAQAEQRLDGIAARVFLDPIVRELKRFGAFLTERELQERRKKAGEGGDELDVVRWIEHVSGEQAHTAAEDEEEDTLERWLRRAAERTPLTSVSSEPTKPRQATEADITSVMDQLPSVPPPRTLPARAAGQASQARRAAELTARARRAASRPLPMQWWEQASRPASDRVSEATALQGLQEHTLSVRRRALRRRARAQEKEQQQEHGMDIQAHLLEQAAAALRQQDADGANEGNKADTEMDKETDWLRATAAQPTSAEDPSWRLYGALDDEVVAKAGGSRGPVRVDPGSIVDAPSSTSTRGRRKKRRSSSAFYVDPEGKVGREDYRASTTEMHSEDPRR